MCGLITVMFKEDCEPQGMARKEVDGACRQMLETLRFRGPDECTLTEAGPVYLGHTRLSIIDLHTGSQPLYNEDRTISVLLNGEIYNYQSLRRDLELRGHLFRTTSDTEAIVHQYEESGAEAFGKLNGMFAIVIYDARKNLLLAARDRAGEKPLVYWESPEALVMASEIKALLKFPGVPRQMDHHALALYLSSMYVPAPLSIFSAIKKLPPAHYLTFDGAKTEIRKYWEPQLQIRWDWGEGDIAEEFVELFSDAVKIRCHSDVPIGVFLSGGIDSSAVSAFMARQSGQRIKTYTVGFAHQTDERPFARLVAERYGTEHTELEVTDRVEDVIEEVIGYYDEPFGDSSAIPTYLVSREARKHVKVILTGDGGDELFAGYGAYLDQKYQTGNRYGSRLYKELNRCALKYLGAGLLEGCYPRGGDPRKAYEHWQRVRSVFVEEELQGGALLRGGASAREYFRSRRWLEVGGDDPLSISYSYDLNYYLPDDLLKKVDMASMRASIECRAPFLDHRLIEFSLRIPPHLKVKNDCLKYLLKKSMADYLPVEVLTRPKTGFGAPVEPWLRKHLKPTILDMLGGECRAASYIDPKAIRRVVDSFYRDTPTKDYRIPLKLWVLFVLEIWLRKYAAA